MTNSIKDIINTFKNLSDEQIIENVPEVVKAPITPIKKQVTKPAFNKKEKASINESKLGTANLETAKSDKPTINALKTVEKIHLSDAFFNALTGQEFVYEDRRIAYIEYDLYEIFMSLKRKKKLKNISVLINAILNQFVEDNKDDIKKILTNAKL